MINFYKGLAMLIVALAYIFVPPMFYSGDYFSGMVNWIDIAFWAFMSALILACLIGKSVENEK